MHFNDQIRQAFHCGNNARATFALLRCKKPSLEREELSRKAWIWLCLRPCTSYSSKSIDKRYSVPLHKKGNDCRCTPRHTKEAVNQHPRGRGELYPRNLLLTSQCSASMFLRASHTSQYVGIGDAGAVALIAGENIVRASCVHGKASLSLPAALSTSSTVTK